jgi:hypothetical protein
LIGLVAAILIGIIPINIGCNRNSLGITRTAAEATPFASPPVLTLKVIPLSSPTPDITRPTSSPNEDSAYGHLYTIMDKYASSDALRLLDSYEPTSTWDDGDTAWVYDNDLVMLALIARGTPADRERARILADTLIYAQNNDPDFADGRVRDAYSAASFVGTDGKPQITSPGSATGNMAWTMLAWLGYWQAKGGTAYLGAATQLGQWIYDHTYDTRGAGGYTGGYSSSLEEYQWKATEHNIDVYLAFIKLYQATGDPVWFGRARHARDFVQAMWNETGGYFWTGTVNDGVAVNPSPIPEDTQSWGLMALGETDTYGAGITWAESDLSLDPCPGCISYHGFKFSDVGDGCWFEGTAHVAVAFQIKGEAAKADDVLGVLRSVQTSAANNNGAGIVAACPEGAETGYAWSYPNALHIGATAWYLFAERRFNPFWQISTSEPIPATPGEFQEGMSYAAWWQDQYSTSDADQSLANLAATGTEWLSLIATGYQETITSTAITYTLPRTPTDADLSHAITQAHSLGMKVMLKPHLDLNNDPTHWRGQIGTGLTTEAEWQAWFASYQDFIGHYASLAQANGVEQFCIGTELVGTSGREADWRQVVSDVRGLFGGPIIYAGNHGGEETSIQWWDAVDYIGVDAYYPLTDKNDPTLAELKAAWVTPTLTLESLSSQHNRPIIFTEIGYRSVDGANQRPWEWQTSGTIDLQEQADCYRAALETLWGKPWLKGIYWWYWSTDPDQGGPEDMDFTPHNKPAERVLRSYYRPSVYLPIVLRVPT